MLVFWKERLVFLATPKTGTTAIEAALAPLASMAVEHPPELKHTSVRRYGRFLAPYLRGAAKQDFAVVALMREPLSWLGSWYRDRLRDAPQDFDLQAEGITFEAFAGAYMSETPPPYADVGTQSDFLAPGEGVGRLTVFRYEEIEVFVRYLEDRLDFEIILPQLKVSPPADLALSRETEARLAKALSADFALYETLGRGETDAG
jgi:hypothetical protein